MKPYLLVITHRDSSTRSIRFAEEAHVVNYCADHVQGCQWIREAVCFHGERRVFHVERPSLARAEEAHADGQH